MKNGFCEYRQASMMPFPVIDGVYSVFSKGHARRPAKLTDILVFWP
jgi:hypothetical protein